LRRKEGGKRGHITLRGQITSITFKEGYVSGVGSITINLSLKNEPPEPGAIFQGVALLHFIFLWKKT